MTLRILYDSRAKYQDGTIDAVPVLRDYMSTPGVENVKMISRLDACGDDLTRSLRSGSRRRSLSRRLERSLVGSLPRRRINSARPARLSLECQIKLTVLPRAVHWRRV